MVKTNIYYTCHKSLEVKPIVIQHRSQGQKLSNATCQNMWQKSKAYPYYTS